MVQEVVIQQYYGTYFVKIMRMVIIMQYIFAIHYCLFVFTFSLKNMEEIIQGRVNDYNFLYYLSTGRFSECFYEIDYMLQLNECPYFNSLNSQQKDALILWYAENFSETKRKAQVSFLFRKDTIKITMYVIAIQIIYYTATSIQQYLLPFIYHDKQKGFESLFFQQVGIIPAVFIQSFFIDSNTFGRAKTGMLISFMLCITYLLIFYQQDTYIPQQMLQWFLLEIQFTVMQIIINESFNSNIRALGMSFTFVVAKISQLLSPVIIFKLYQAFNVFTQKYLILLLIFSFQGLNQNISFEFWMLSNIKHSFPIFCY